MGDDATDHDGIDDQVDEIDEIDEPTPRRRRGGIGGIIGSGMLGLAQVLYGTEKQEAPVVVDANSDPIDIDRDGIVIPVDDEVSVVAPPMPRRDAPAAVAGTAADRARRTKRYRGG